MNFRSRTSANEPEISLIAFIDVLLVVLIFLMLSTTYSKFTELQIKLPVADTEAQRTWPKELLVSVGADGGYSVNRVALAGRSVQALGAAIAEAAKDAKDTVVVINADANSTHQSVITVLEAARSVGLGQITFAARSSAGAAGRPVSN